MVLTLPVERHTTLSAQNAYALVHARICNGAEASLPWKLLRTHLESCASIAQAVVCRPLLLPLLLSRPNPSPDAVRSRNPSKSTLVHDAVAAVVSHKHHSIIRVGAGLIQFVHRGSLHQELYCCNFFARVFTLTGLFVEWAARARVRECRMVVEADTSSDVQAMCIVRGRQRVWQGVSQDAIGSR